MGDPFRIERERPPDLRRATPLAGMKGDPEAARPGDREGRHEPERVRVALLLAGQVPAGEARVAEADRRLGQLHVAFRGMRAEGGADESDDGPGPGRRVGRAPADRRDPVGETQPAHRVEGRPPADLDVADLLGGLRLDELAGHPLERLGILEQGDRQVEPLEQLGLGRRALGRDEGVEHPGVGGGCLDTTGPGQLEGRLDPHGTVEVEVELGLRHRPDEPAERCTAESRSAGRSWPVDGVGHGPDATLSVPGPTIRSGCRTRTGIGTVAPSATERRPEESSTMTTILVTGASGFVGSHVIPELIGAGHRVVALGHAPSSGERVLARLAPADRASVEVRTGDVTDPATLAPALAGVDAVVHLVALPRDRGDGGQLARVNTEGTRALVAAMTEAGVRRLVHLGALGVTDDPELHYASSKARAEAIVASSDLDWTILKPSLLWGERDGFFNIVADLVRLSPGIVPVPGDGMSRFQPLAVDDLARAVRLSLEDPRHVGRAYELGGPRFWTYREITAEVCTAMHRRRADRAHARPAHPPGGGHGRAGRHPVPGGHRPAPSAQAR